MFENDRHYDTTELSKSVSLTTTGVGSFGRARCRLSDWGRAANTGCGGPTQTRCSPPRTARRPDEGGWFTLVRHTIAKRMRAKLVEIKEALNRMRHVPVPEQGRWLGQVVRGYFAYHAVPTNSRKPRPSTTMWSALATRALAPEPESQRLVGADEKIAARWLPPARISHPWPQRRFLVKHPRWEPSALVAPARICPGGAG